MIDTNTHLQAMETSEAKGRRRANLRWLASVLLAIVALVMGMAVMALTGCQSARVTRVVINGTNVIETGETSQFPWVMGESDVEVHAVMVDDRVTSASVTDRRSKSVLEALGLAGIAVGAAAASGGGVLP